MAAPLPEHISDSLPEHMTDSVPEHMTDSVPEHTTDPLAEDVTNPPAKPRVLVFIVQYPNFSETYMQEEIRQLKAKYDVHIITYRESPHPRKEPFDYTLIDYDLPCFVYYPHDQVDWSFSRPESIAFLEKAGKVIEEFKPDILHAHYFGLAAPLEKLAEKYRLPFSIRTHSMDILEEPSVKLERLCSLANSAWSAGVLVMPYFRQRLLDHGLAETKIADCWPLINFDRFYKPERREKTGKILCAGPSTPKKAHSHFVDLALMMKEAGSDLEFDLYSDGYTIQNTIDYNESKGNPVNITYADPDEMPDVYTQYDWMIYPADPEINKVGFPVGMVEAQASGLGILWQELPKRRDEQLRNLDGAGILYRSLDEIPAIIARPYPEEMREKGFERARRCDAKRQNHILTDLWDSFFQKRDQILNPQELVSIVIPYYEKAEFIGDTVDSALNQSYGNIEVILVDDASRDNPAESVLDDAQLSKIKVIKHDTNLGVSAARNTAIGSARGKYIVPLDADDLLDKDYVLKCVQTAVAGDFDAVYTQMQWFGDSGYLMTPKANLINLLSHKEGFPTFLYKKEVFDKVGGYHEDMLVGSDHQFILSTAAAGFSMARIGGALWFYRKSNEGLASIDVEKRMSNLITHNRDLYEKHWPEVIARIDSYYLNILDEYLRTSAANEKTTAASAETAEQYRVIFNEYKKVLPAYEHLVGETEIQKERIERLKERLHKSLSASDMVSIPSILKSDVRAIKNKLNKAGKLNRDTLDKVSASGIFDANYYSRQCKQEGIVFGDALEHFVEEGWKIPIDPSPLFDIEFYKKQLAQHHISCVGNPLVHFIEHGAKLGIATSEFFDTGWYTSNYADVKDSGINPLKHFISFGSLEGRYSMDPLSEHAGISLEQSSSARPSKELSPSKVEGIYDEVEGSYDLILGLHEASWTGAPLLGQALARSFRKRGLNPLILVRGDGPLLEELNQEFDILDLSNRGNPQKKLDERLKELLDSGRLRSKTVILNSAELFPLLQVFRENGIKVVTLIHEFLSSYGLNIRESLRQKTDLAIFSCEAVKEEALETTPGAWSRTSVIPQGLLDPRFGKGLDRKEARKVIASATGAVDNDFIVLACGTAETRKGIDIFVQVAINVLSRYEKKAQFIWIGSAHNTGPDALTWARKDVSRAGVTRKVHFLESMKEIEPFFVGADLFLLPSRQDPLPCVVHQAMNCSTPVVAFQRSGGAEEVLENGGGMLAPFLDVTAMTEAIVKMIEDPTERARQGELAARIVAEQYNFEDYADHILEQAKITQKTNTTPEATNAPETESQQKGSSAAERLTKERVTSA